MTHSMQAIDDRMIDRDLVDELCDAAWIDGAITAVNHAMSENYHGLNELIMARHNRIAQARKLRKEQG